MGDLSHHLHSFQWICGRSHKHRNPNLVTRPQHQRVTWGPTPSRLQSSAKSPQQCSQALTSLLCPLEGGTPGFGAQAYAVTVPQKCPVQRPAHRAHSSRVHGRDSKEMGAGVWVPSIPSQHPICLHCGPEHRNLA